MVACRCTTYTWAYISIQGYAYSTQGYTWVYIRIYMGYIRVCKGIHGDTWVYMGKQGYTWIYLVYTWVYKGTSVHMGTNGNSTSTCNTELYQKISYITHVLSFPLLSSIHHLMHDSTILTTY